MPGYDWRDSSGNVDASSSGYNYNTGTSWGNTNNNNNNNTNNNYYSNPDAGYDDSWESEVQTGANNVYANLKDTYTPPNQVYGPGTATPGETGYAFTKFDPKILKGIDPKVLAFFGYTGGPNIPVELLKMITEGSILGGPEAGNSTEFGTGTYSDIESGSHPLSKFYKQIMRQSNLIDITQSGGGGGGGGGWSGSWGGPGRYGSGIGGMYSRRWNPHMKNVNNYNSPIAEQLAYNRANQARPQNQWMFTQMLQSMPGGGITNAV
jgi:hypothetical protein